MHQSTRLHSIHEKPKQPKNPLHLPIPKLKRPRFSVEMLLRKPLPTACFVLSGILAAAAYFQLPTKLQT
jgi:hypothetical protein